MGSLTEKGTIQATVVDVAVWVGMTIGGIGGFLIGAMIFGMDWGTSTPADRTTHVARSGGMNAVATAPKELGRIAIVVEGDEAFAVHDVAGDAAELSGRLNCRVNMRYRGKRMVAYPGRKVESIVGDYTRGLEIEAEAKGP